MNFIAEYLAVLDAVAVAALVVLAVASFFRRETMWMGILAVVVAGWAAVRFFGLV